MPATNKPSRPAPVQFRPGMLERPLKARAGDRPLGWIASRDLERYYRLLDIELRRLVLTENEALLICDACNGTLFDPESARLLWADIAEVGLGEKWGVDDAALVEKLKAASPAATIAICDAVERFWVRSSLDPKESRELVHDVGLAKRELKPSREKTE